MDRLIDTADVATLRVLGDALPRYSMLLVPTSVKVTAALVGLLREAAEADRDAYLPDLATSVNNLAIRLGEAGRRAEGLAAAQEAVDLRRELVELNRDAYLPDLAASVNNLAADLGEAGRREQALALAREAAAHYNELARTNPEVFGPDAEQAESLVTTLVENES